MSGRLRLCVDAIARPARLDSGELGGRYAHRVTDAKRLRGAFIPSDSVGRSIRLAVKLERYGQIGRRLGHLVRYRLARSWGIFVHPSAQVGAVRFAHPTSVVIGAGVVIEDDVLIWQNVTLGALELGGTGYPVIRKGARLYAGASVLGPVEIGERATVGAHSLVLQSIPPGSTAVGAPARVIS